MENKEDILKLENERLRLENENLKLKNTNKNEEKSGFYILFPLQVFLIPFVIIFMIIMSIKDDYDTRFKEEKTYDMKKILGNDYELFERMQNDSKYREELEEKFKYRK